MRYKEEVYIAMKEPYEMFLDDGDSRDELIEMVDSLEPHELFGDLCDWHGVRTSLVEFIYETIYGKGTDKGEFGWYPLYKE